MASRSQLFSIILSLSLILLISRQSMSKYTDYPPIRIPPLEAIINVTDVADALWNAGYRHAAHMLLVNLCRLVPYGSFQPNSYGIKNFKHILVFENETLTIFAPLRPSKKESLAKYLYQFVPFKVDKESFDSGFLSKGSELRALDLFLNLVVSEVPDDGGFPLINGVQITKWDIYNDGYIIVHGVEAFFPRKFGAVKGKCETNEGICSLAAIEDVNLDLLLKDFTGLDLKIFND